MLDLECRGCVAEVAATLSDARESVDFGPILGSVGAVHWRVGDEPVAVKAQSIARITSDRPSEAVLCDRSRTTIDRGAAGQRPPNSGDATSGSAAVSQGDGRLQPSAARRNRNWNRVRRRSSFDASLPWYGAVPNCWPTQKRDCKPRIRPTAF